MTMTLRPFGKSGVKVSALGLGGHHLGQAPSLAAAVDLAHAAIDGGITFFDNCWEYHQRQERSLDGRGVARQARPRVFDDQGVHARS